MREIETVLFDLGGVLVDWDPRHLYRKIFDDPADMEHFLSEICHPHWNFLHDKGALSFAKSIPDLQHRHPDHADQIAAWWDRWPEMLKGQIDRKWPCFCRPVGQGKQADIAAWFKLNPRETLFIDDSEKNIQQAREMGFMTHWFNDPVKLRREMIEDRLV